MGVQIFDFSFCHSKRTVLLISSKWNIPVIIIIVVVIWGGQPGTHATTVTRTLRIRIAKQKNQPTEFYEFSILTCAHCVQHRGRIEHTYHLTGYTFNVCVNCASVCCFYLSLALFALLCSTLDELKSQLHQL